MDFGSATGPGQLCSFTNRHWNSSSSSISLSFNYCLNTGHTFVELQPLISSEDVHSLYRDELSYFGVIWPFWPQLTHLSSVSLMHATAATSQDMDVCALVLVNFRRWLGDLSTGKQHK